MWRRMIALAECACRASAKPFSVLSLINAAADLASSPRRGLHPATTLAAFAAQVPGAEFAVVPGAAHGFLNDRPEEALGILRPWLRRQDRA